MVGNIMDVVKQTGSSKSSQAQKNKKASNDKSAFGQALTDAAGAANSANAQGERQTYEQKDSSVVEKATESVQAAEEKPGQQGMLAQEAVEGKDALAGLMQMGADGAQAVEEMDGLWSQSMAGAAQEAEAALTTGETGFQADSLNAGDLNQGLSAEGEIALSQEELAAKAEVMKSQTEAKEEQAASDMGKDAGASKNVKEERNIVDVKAEAAADKAGISYNQIQGGSDSGVIEAKVEVAETGDIKPEYAEMLKDMIAKQISNGRQEFEISLTPRNLGELLVKVAYEAGETTVSIICTNAKAMQAMSSKAGELGRMLENTLGDRMDVVVEDKNGQESHFYEDGRNDSGTQAQKDEQERRHEESRRRMEQEASSADFLQQLRLGLA